MRRLFFLILVWAAICVHSNIAVPASERLAVVIAASSSLENLSMETLRLIYKRKAQVDAQGTPWIPLNLPVSAPLRQVFSRALFDALPEEMESYWNIQYFQGINPPQVVASEEAVLRFVAATPGAIGYVGERQVDARVKVLRFVSHDH